MSATGFQILRSSDGGAPTLNGTAGSLIGVLDVLLDIGGSDGLWEKVFSGTNKAAYRAFSGERYYLRVDDSSAQSAAVRGFATMSDVDTGTGQFPTGTQQTNFNWFKSNTADSTARTYLGIATDRFFLLLVSGGWSGSGQDLFFFGEPKKFYSSDTGSTVIRAHPASSFGSSSMRGHVQTASNPWNAATSYTAPANNSNSMMPFAKSADGATDSASGLTFGGSPSSSLPFGTYGLIIPVPLIIGSVVSGSAGLPRGALPHIYHTCSLENDANLSVGDTFSDSDGRTYQLCTPSGTSGLSSSNSMFAIMTSNDESGVP